MHTNVPSKSKAKERAELQKAVEKFLENEGKIQKIPRGYSSFYENQNPQRKEVSDRAVAASKRARRKTNVDAFACYTHHKNGKSIEYIADMYGVSRDYIRKKIKSYKEYLSKREKEIECVSD